MIKIISKSISYLFHPLLIPTWIVILFVTTNPYAFAGLSINASVAIVFINTFMFPAIAILMMRRLGFLESLEMLDNKQRIIPMVATIVFYVWAYMAIRKTNFPIMMSLFMMGTLVSLFLSFFINVFYKLSLHMVGISGALAMMILMIFTSPSDITYYLLGLIVLTGAIATARLYLNAHTMKEVYAGFLVGILGQLIGLFILY